MSKAKAFILKLQMVFCPLLPGYFVQYVTTHFFPLTPTCTSNNQPVLGLLSTASYSIPATSPTPTAIYTLLGTYHSPASLSSHPSWHTLSLPSWDSLTHTHCVHSLALHAHWVTALSIVSSTFPNSCTVTNKLHLDAPLTPLNKLS